MSRRDIGRETISPVPPGKQDESTWDQGRCAQSASPAQNTKYFFYNMGLNRVYFLVSVSVKC